MGIYFIVYIYIVLITHKYWNIIFITYVLKYLINIACAKWVAISTAHLSSISVIAKYLSCRYHFAC